MKILLYFILVIVLNACNGANVKDNIAPKNTKKETTWAKQIYRPLLAYNQDTLSYLEDNFVKNKSFYLNKEFKVFKRRLEIPIVEVFPMQDFSYEKEFQPTTNALFVYFYYLKYARVSRENTLKSKFLTIYFEEPVNFAAVTNLLAKNKNVWTKEVDDYFKDRKISNIVRIIKSQPINKKLGEPVMR